MSVLRPLPSRPSLEFDRKEAKELHRRATAGDPDAIVRARAHHPAFSGGVPTTIRLADAQMVIAREYGFASWPRFIDRHGRHTAVARQSRPPLNAMNLGMLPQLPDPDDEELLLEGFAIALLNGRLAVMEYLVSRGFDVNTLRWGTPLVYIAVANGMTAVAECLVRCGADLDLTGWGQPQSAREAARERIARMKHSADDRRLAVVCGVDPDAVRAQGDPAE